MTMKIQRRYFIILFLVFSSVSILLAYTAYSLANGTMINKYRELYESETRYMLTICETEIEQLASTFQFLKTEVDFEELDENTSTYEKIQAIQRMDEIMASVSNFDIMRYIQNVVRVNSSGFEYWQGYGKNNNENLIVEALIEKLDDDNKELMYIQIEDSVFVTETAEKVLQFGQHNYTVSGEQSGYLFFELNAEYFDVIFGNYKPTVESVIYLVDSTDTILYTNTDYEIGDTLDRTVVSSESESDIVIEETLSCYGWSLIIGASKELITEDNRIILQTTLLVAFFSILLELILILYIIKRLFTPILALGDGLSRLSAGDFNIKIDIESDDEIGDACRNFNILSDTLESTMEKELDYQLMVKDSEYKALQSQINPHFLYNSLNSLKWMATIQKSESIKNMVDSLWKLFKIASHSQGKFVSLTEEMELIDAYAYIQNVRYKHKFELETEISEELQEFRLPQFILQPFVENAIFHGIAPKEGTGIIVIKAFLEQGEDGVAEILNLEVSDDGVGMDEKKVVEILYRNESENYGSGMNNLAVYNVRDRLSLLYNREDLLYITSEIGVGTTVHLRLPIYGERSDRIRSRIKE